MATLQPKRLSYTRRDLESYHDDVSRFLKEFIPRITETSEANEGRLFLTAFEALVDNTNFSLDQIHLEGNPRTAKLRKNIIESAYFVDYKPVNVSAASVDGTVSMLTGVAPVGGQAIPIYTRFQANTSPVLEFLSVSAVTILEGAVSATIPLVQGTRTVDYILTNSASGLPNQTYRLPVPNTPTEYVEIKVSAVSWERPTSNDLYDSDPIDQHYYATIDDDNYITINFGDGVAGDEDTFGLIPPAGAQITVTYIQCDLDTGNVAAGAITGVVGALASTVGITNALKASGGADAESNTSIITNLSAHARTFDRAVRSEDYVAFAKSLAGVYDAYAKHTDGPQNDVYILPDGGGVASSTLISQVQDTLDTKKFEGALVTVHALRPAYILTQANMILQTSRVQKSTSKAKAITAIREALEYTNLKTGKGFKISDLSKIFEDLDSNTLVDYVDLIQVSRVPSVVKSNSLAPDMVGRVEISTDVGYSTYLVQAISTTQYIVSIDGTPEAVQGTVATQYTPADGTVTFTLGETGDTFTVGDTWTFKTSKYKDNMYLEADEYMDLEKDSDISIGVFYPNEYDFTTNSAS